MQILKCNEAIKFFSSNNPTQWSAMISSEIRQKWLQEKQKALSIWPRHWLTQLPRTTIPQRPYPVRSHILNMKVSRETHMLLFEFFADSPYLDPVRKALDNIHTGDRFGTDWIDHEWRIIAPESKGTLGHLMGLSHELGHILANESLNPSLPNLVRGESTALVLEALIVGHQLNISDLQNWKHYCRLIDEYNFAFARIEFGKNLQPLMNDNYIFRETLWTSHGYQAVYALSSFLRMKLLEKWYTGH